MIIFKSCSFLLLLRLIMTSIPAYYVWEWEDENGKWNPYNAKTCLDLMTAQKEEETWVASKAAGRSYTIHIDRMEQVNTATNVKRAVRLQKTGELYVVVMEISKTI